MHTYDRNGLVLPPSAFEKTTILPLPGETDPCIFAFTDGRFAVEIMMEHSLFFVMLMPPDIVKGPREEAQKFYTEFELLLDKINATGVPKPTDLRTFCTALIDCIKPFIDYKKRMRDLQISGKLRSLVWPLFFEHTLREAVRWSSRLDQLSRNDSAFSKAEVLPFWTQIVEEHDQFTAHLLDPTETELVGKATTYAAKFKELNTGCTGEIQCDTSTVLSSMEEALLFSTAAVQGIELGQIKSIIDPILADHLRRETLKGCDEMRRLTD
jgi:hypothetical protein